MPHRVVAVLVAHDRRVLLLEALRALIAQTRPPEAVVVVDNASSDGTAQAVRAQFPAVDLVELAENVGGAGGFAVGIERALARHAADWVWIMDDDAEPTPGALAALLDAADRYPGERPALLASRVVWHNGRDLPMNTPRAKVAASRREVEAARAVGCVPVRSASFVSVLVSADAARAAGPPVADYFLWNDDFEFTTRLLRTGIGLYCPSSYVVHKTRTFSATDPGDRFYYEVRNKIWTFTRSDALAWPERLLYGGATLRRWALTVGGSPDRKHLVGALRRGLRDGLRAAPRPNEEVLAGARRPEALQ